jgi:hypothetical protein
MGQKNEEGITSLSYVLSADTNAASSSSGEGNNPAGAFQVPEKETF